MEWPVINAIPLEIGISKVNVNSLSRMFNCVDKLYVNCNMLPEIVSIMHVAQLAVLKACDEPSANGHIATIDELAILKPVAMCTHY